jgi:CrcB protein
MKTAIAIALFCAGGGLTRYYLSAFVYSVCGRNLPYGTFAVNIIGSFLIGLVMEFGLRSTVVPPDIRIGLTVGFMGGLTTFSTFSYETPMMLEDGRLMASFVNILASVLFCIVFTWLGIWTVRTLY